MLNFEITHHNDSSCNIQYRLLFTYFIYSLASFIPVLHLLTNHPCIPLAKLLLSD